MARSWTYLLLLLISTLQPFSIREVATSASSPAVVDADATEIHTVIKPVLTPAQQDLVDFALGRFEAHGLALPEIEFVFHDDLLACDGHKGLYYKTTMTLEMCAMEKHTMLHELAHAWANENLTAAEMNQFVAVHDLDSWNDHSDAWARRGTEHAAETLAWALLDDPNHVRWVETLSDGSQVVSYRILTLDVDVKTLAANFRFLTDQDPDFRNASEWSTDPGPAVSPELARLRG